MFAQAFALDFSDVIGTSTLGQSCRANTSTLMYVFPHEPGLSQSRPLLCVRYAARDH